MTPTDALIKRFASQQAWAAWLEKNHAASSGIWIRIAKKAAGLKSVTHLEALDVALCYGWIDGQRRSYDESTFLQKFTPRGPRSLWSKINVAKAQALIESGRMKPAGLEAVERAKQDGRWDRAYVGQRNAEVPDDLRAELSKSKRAQAFFESLDSRNRYAILFRIQTAKKAETRARRIQQFVQMLERGEKLHP